MEATITLPAQAQPKKKIKTGTVIALAGGTVALVGGYFVFFYKDSDGNTLWQKWTGASGDKAIDKVDAPTEAPPAGVQWVAESANPFPLKKGSWGGYTKNLQKALGLKDDGKFGSGTEAKVKAKWNKTTVDKADYDSLVNPTASGGGSNFQSLVKEFQGHGKNDKDGVRFPMQGANKTYTFKFWTNGRMGVTPNDVQKWKMGTYIDGGKKIYMDGGDTYAKGSALTNMAYVVKWMDAGAKPSISSEIPYWANK